VIDGRTAPGPDPSSSLEHTIARLLTIGTYLSIALLVIGLGLRLATGGGASAGPAFDLTRLVPDLFALTPEGFLWLGLLVVVATPAARVVASLVGYLRRGEPRMAIVAALILLVIAASVVLAVGLGG
jgi:uncharacterized membrane protein